MYPMPVLAWILVASTAMALIALSGSITLALPAPVFNRIVLPLVALAAGSLLGGALFHLTARGRNIARTTSASTAGSRPG